MAGPDWLDGFFSTLMVAVAVYSVGRLVASRRWARPTHADVDAAHVLMGAAMAGMLSASLNPIRDGAWETIFGLLALWFVWRCVRFVGEHGLEGRDEDHVHHLSHYVTHLVMVSAMLYMYAVATPGVGSSSHAGMAMNGVTGTTTDFVGLPLFCVGVLLASAIWEMDGIGRFSKFQVDSPPELRVRRPVRAGVAAALDDLPAATAIGAELQEVPERGSPWVAPRLEAACHIAMCITMGYMLVLIL